MTQRDHRGAPVPFQIEFCTCNEQTGEGGELISIEGVVLAKDAGAPARPKAGPVSARPAHEWENATRNFYILESQQIRKAHIRLITQFNFQTVVY